MRGPSLVHPIFKQIWNTTCRLRHKIFIWLLLHDMINSRNLLNRKSMHLNDYNCALCSDNTEEKLLHLFCNCPFALQCWESIILSKLRGISVFDDFQLAMAQLPPDIALDIVSMGCWGIWSIRNDKIFRAAAPHIQGWKFYLQEGLWAAQIKEKHSKAAKISSWVLQNI